MTFREEIHRQSQAARREMVRTKQLLTLNEFCERLGVSERRLTQMVAVGSAFSIAVDGVEYLPALLTDPTVDRKRLQSVCRILVPAPPECRLDYLSSRQSNLGDITPLEALADEKNYRWLREMARAWAAEWSRTTVQIYARPCGPTESQPMYVAVCEVDPRIKLWKRAMAAMDAGGYVAPPGPYPRADAATVLIVRSEAGKPDDVEEARLDVSVCNGAARVLVHARDSRQVLEDVSVAGANSIVEVVHRVIESFCGVHKR
ncbi:hypothetical protein [Burkholderia pseudomallei]|uniref:hypothetical protein n=1 Tax=Burkholderia pseudomallei TaxID=28450 RepID=UPI00050D5FBE|nr:hypothetical protein [Burkholderia pseudomallei]AIP49929.1 hypothetical protein DR55_996 [Burkholderia pseudomallei HBPUB10134a]MBF3555375.1 hypothetical protein [Burkholderia pseudomallei]CAJ3215926.1 Uncharacterised protein [Burkholderia pseudomallei]CAJ4278881.1 Uncharacterised protein [Burkholderia pseudomallei]CAJ4378051.1 Uncharacterised protein [Burkholderia pseudomallei]